MSDYLGVLKRYQDIKEISDLIDDVEKLREYYHSGQYDKMQQHIQSLMVKYLAETVVWNSSHTVAPQTPDQSYQNAEAFLYTKFQALVVKGGLSSK